MAYPVALGKVPRGMGRGQKLVEGRSHFGEPAIFERFRENLVFRITVPHFRPPTVFVSGLFLFKQIRFYIQPFPRNLTIILTENIMKVSMP